MLYHSIFFQLPTIREVLVSHSGFAEGSILSRSDAVSTGKWYRLFTSRHGGHIP